MLNSRTVRLFACAALGLAAPVVTPGQENSPVQRNISVNEGRPLYEAVKQLRERYGWLITYQDPPYEHPDDVEPREGAPVRHMVPRRMHISVDYAEPQTNSAEERRRAIDQVVEGFSAAGAGQFRVYHSGEFSYVVPVAVKRASGIVESLPPMCEMTVSFPPAQRMIEESVSLVLGQVSQESHTMIALATAPANVFLGDRYLSQAHDERACDALVRVLEAVNVPRVAVGLPPGHMLWSLLYDPTAKEYFFNVKSVGAPPPLPPHLRIEPKKADR